ncbi:MAG: MFS transporter [Patescibacteria group bacterium]|nr:MFS transporter [Patescibacteria group bacterium]
MSLAIKTDSHRTEELKSNGVRLFWLSALLNVNTFGVFSTIFYLNGGMTLQQVFYTAVVWAVVGLLSETPSSYMADRWGRKRTIVLGVLLMAGSTMALMISRSLWPVMASFVLAALGYSCISGTDEALVYDTKLELGEKGQSLTSLARLASAKYVPKILVPLVAALVAKDLTDSQAMILLVIDLVTSVAAAVMAMGLVEPRHQYEVVEQEAGIMRKAWGTLKDNGLMRRAVFGRAVIMSAALVLWRYHAELMVGIGVAPLVLGVSWAAFHVLLVAYYRTENETRGRWSLEKRIDFGNAAFLIIGLAFIASWYWLFQPYLLMVLFLAHQFSDVARWPKYSEYFNRHAASFSRATTLSMANAMKSVLDIPFMIIAAQLSGNPIWPWWLVVMAACVVVFTCRLSGGGKSEVAVTA